MEYRWCGRKKTRRTAPACQRSSRRYPSCDKDARQREGPGPYLPLFTECCSRVQWCTPSCLDSLMTCHAESLFFSLDAQHTNHIHFLPPLQFKFLEF